MTLEDYSNQLLKIAKSHDGEYGTCCELDLSQEEHFKCVEYLFGGKELFEKNYPKIYKSAMLSKEYKGEKILNANQKVGFANVTELLDIYYDKNKKVLSACGIIYLTHNSPQIYMSVIVMRAGKQIGFGSAYAFGDSFAKISISIPNIEFENNNNEVSVLIQSIWQDSNTNMMKSQIAGTNCNASATVSINDIVTDVTLIDPVHKRTPLPPPTDDIIVIFGRKSQVHDVYDYDYPIARTPDNLQKMYLEVEGTIELTKDVTSITDFSSILTMNTIGFGGSIYAGVKPIFTTTSNNTFTFKFNKDWGDIIECSADFNDKQHYFNLLLFFKAHTSSECVNGIVCIGSTTPVPADPNNHFKKISEFYLYWGCFGKDTLISMAEGSPKKIQDIVKGDKVKSKDGKIATVNATLKGDNDPIIYTMRLFDGKEVKATETHPFMTDTRMKPLIRLIKDEKILLEDGTYSTVEYIYPTKGSFEVYNLILEGDDRIVFANGIAAGDNTAQNTSYAPLMKKMAVDEDLVNEMKRLKEYHEKMNL